MGRGKQFSRRRFLAATASALAAPAVIPGTVLGMGGASAPSERITIGIIGTGGMGRGNAGGFMRNPDAQVVAVCDVDQQHLDRAAGDINKRYKNKDCKKYKNFRELIGRKDIDAICIATPDHWHAICAIAAANAKKDVFCQKPMTHTFPEGQAVVAAVKKNNIIFQVGSQQRSNSNFRRAVELILNQRIGKVRRVEVGLPTGHKAAKGDTRVQEPPPHADYDFWCGPSPKLPFTPARFHWNWRWHLSFGGGQLMDWIGHHNDIAHWGLDCDDGGPLEVQAVGFEYPQDRTVWNAAWKYEVLCKYENDVVTSISNKYERGCKWIGEEGWVFVARGKFRASNEEWTKGNFDPGSRRAYQSSNHERNFLDGVKTRKPCICTAEIGHRSITPGHLGLLSEALGGRTIKWNPKKEIVIGDPEADKLLKKVDYRKPWIL